MLKYNILFFSLLLLFSACGGDKIPGNVINPDGMSNLLTEIHLADGSMYNTMQVPDSLYKYGTAKYLMVFKTFHTDSIQFKRSLKYYSEKPEQLALIYEQVAANLKVKSDSLNKLNQQQMAKDAKRRADSIKNLPKQTVPQTIPAGKANPSIPAKPFANKRYYIPIKPKPNAHPIK